eukprot:Sspe_Gene.33400::Locus_16304_Transcript_3_3_Confidence_0.600_Length_989::g.33400::m.33400
MSMVSSPATFENTLSAVSVTPHPPKSTVDVTEMHRACLTPTPAMLTMQEKWTAKSTPTVSPSVTESCDDDTWTPGAELCEAESPCSFDTEVLPTILSGSMATLLERIAATADQPADSVFTTFCPAMSFADYVARVAYHTGLTVAPYIAALMLIDRLDSKKSVIHTTTLHKLFLAALSIAAKAVEEYQLPDAAFAAIGAVSQKELRACELEMLTGLEWEIGVNEDSYSQWLNLVLDMASVPLSAVGNIGVLGA